MSLKFKAILFRDRSSPLSAPNFKKTLTVANKQGGTVEAAISGVIKTINSIINYSLFFISNLSNFYREK